jgi:hypothetical protein
MSTPSSFPRLADHVRACRVGDQLIFLDLLRSKYIAAGGPLISDLCEAVLAGAAASDTSLAPSNSARLEHWLEHLREKRLLSDGPPQTPARRARPPVEAVRSLLVDDEIHDGPPAWLDLLRLWRSTQVASWWLRRRSLSDIADQVVALRARHAARTQSISPGAMSAAVAAYARLRPLALTAHDRCLNDSLTLIHFLASRGLFPHWVIGVRVHPFAAHSWVQSGDVVVNDQAERVRHYKPILVV